MARMLQISTRQLCRYTEQTFGLSAQRWLNQQRINLAAELLRETRSPKFVAMELGFKQLAHFSREFKSFHGRCPRDFLGWCDAESR